MLAAGAPAPVSAAGAAGVATDEFDVLRPACDRTCKCCSKQQKMRNATTKQCLI